MPLRAHPILTRSVAGFIRLPTSSSTLPLRVSQARAITTSRTCLNASGNPPPSGQNASSQEKREAMEDRHTIDRQSDETSKSGTDDVVAAQSNISFNTNEHDNDPSELRFKASRQTHWSNPLNASPANPSMSESTAEVEGGAKKKTVIIEEEKGTYSGKKRAGECKLEAGFEKRVFAGSTTGGKQKGKGHQDPPLVEQGVR
jgi:hypothetical protein